jgi:hypothetical protein
MALTATKTPTGYAVEGTDSAGKDVEVFYDSFASRNFDYLTEVVDGYEKNKEFRARRAEIKDPERELYIEIFGSDNKPEDSVLHTTLQDAVEAQDGFAVDWSQDPVTAVLRLITTGNSNRLRLFAGNLVDMGPQAKRKAPVKRAPAKKAAAKS